MVKAKREETAAAVEGVVEAAVPEAAVPVVLEPVLSPMTVEGSPVESRVEVTGSELAVALIVAVPLELEPETVVTEAELETVGAIEKMAVSAKTWLILPMLTAWMV